jgi:hypothetical protein
MNSWRMMPPQEWATMISGRFRPAASSRRASSAAMFSAVGGSGEGSDEA